MKQESLSPCPTPRATAVKANELLAEQYAGALNSQMGENTYIDTYIYTSKESTPTLSRELSPPVDSADLDLLHMKFLDSEAQHDEAIEARDEAIEARDKALANLARMKTDFDQAVDEQDTAIRERDVALEKLTRWNEAAVSAAELARLASEQVWIA
ncbi:hypothetical protein B0H10DRAFT_1942538 [Mycena sp. CBHHK59/15]|nr:hypothetical protein B0H10DRAFT_1942538 [Mycena sp. CBHHK59/15]